MSAAAEFVRVELRRTDVQEAVDELLNAAGEARAQGQFEVDHYPERYQPGQSWIDQAAALVRVAEALRAAVRPPPPADREAPRTRSPLRLEPCRDGRCDVCRGKRGAVSVVMLRSAPLLAVCEGCAVFVRELGAIVPPADGGGAA